VTTACSRRYDASRDAVRLPVHRDTSLLSLNIALSPLSAFDGGGTCFEALRLSEVDAERSRDAGGGAKLGSRGISLDRGHAMCHASGLRHGGQRITRGECVAGIDRTTRAMPLRPLLFMTFHDYS